MRITEEQERILGSLHCERLSSNVDNFRLVDDFYNGRNPSIVNTLQNEAYEDDANHRVAYYVVKNNSGEILFYFSLKCGLLYDEFLEGDRLLDMKAFYEHIFQLSKDPSLQGTDKDAINAILEKARTKKGLKKLEVARALHLSLDSEELLKIFGENNKNVGTTFAGVEIVHFCANEAHRDFWYQTGIHQKLGTVVFWQFIVPKILDLMEIVGCEYLFLFAADLSEDADLVNYYVDNLEFIDASEHSAATPMYDFACRFCVRKQVHYKSEEPVSLSTSIQMRKFKYLQIAFPPWRSHLA